MSKSLLIMVTESAEYGETLKRQWSSSGVQVLVYSPAQWREGLDNPFFKQQLLTGAPALSGGNSSATSNVTDSASGGAGTLIQFPQGSGAGAGGASNVQKMEALEAQAIENAILQYKGNLTEAAKALGIGRATLYRKVKQYNIDPAVARKRKVAA